MSFLQIDQDLARDSYYAATAPRTQAWPELQSSVSVDVAVVGGGLAGLSAALELAARGHKVALLEAKRVAWGASGRNGGQALAGLACDHAVIESQLGLESARQVWDMSFEAIDLIHRRMAEHQIDCDWQSGFLSLAINAKKGAALRQWRDHMAQGYGYATEWIEPSDMGRWIDSPRFHSGLYDARSGHLHPLKYSLGLARAAALAGVQIFENSPLLSLDSKPLTASGHQPAYLLRTAHGELCAGTVLLAGNVYLQGIAKVLEPRIMPVGTYIVTSEELPADRFKSLIPSMAAVCDTNFVLDYFRPTPDRRVLYGGRVSYSTATPRKLTESMQARMVRTFPQLEGVKVTHSWGGFVDITMNRAPDFGRLSDRLGDKTGKAWRNVFYLQGFSGHGLALTGLAGKLVAEAIDGDARRFDVFTRLRHRRFPGGPLLRTPALVLAMAYYRMRDLL
jgi:gamma-glutamylputrescine oxidase